MSMIQTLDDAQTRPPLDTCERCGGELWGDEAEPDQFGRVYCPECRSELSVSSAYDHETVKAVMEVMDMVLEKYLSKNLCDTVWNEVSGKFPAA